MLLDIKKLFTKGTTLGRFEYIKVMMLYPLSVILVNISFASIIPFINNKILFHIILAITIVTLVCCNIVCLIATYKRFRNIFDKTVISIILLLVFFISGKISLLQAIFVVLLMIIPDKKKSDSIVSNKIFWVILPLSVILFIFWKYSGVYRFVVSEAMTNTLQLNDRLFINIFENDYKRGDIIIFKPPIDSKYVHVMRVVALPEEKIDFKVSENSATYLYVNNKKLNESYVKNVYDYPNPEKINIPYTSLIVPKDCYYVLGDNRGNSYDSRFYGPVCKNNVKGKVINIWYPYNRRKVFETPEYSDVSVQTSDIVEVSDDIQSYMNFMQKTMKTNWTPPEFDKSLTVTVTYTILPDGEIINPQVKTSSGNKKFDKIAIATVKKVGELPPLPDEIVKQHGKADTEFTFTYNVKKKAE